MVSQSQPQSKKVRLNAIKAKTYQKVCFWQLENIPGGQNLYTIPKNHNTHSFINILSALLSKTVIFPNFIVYI